jgi:hypothetical protein
MVEFHSILPWIMACDGRHSEPGPGEPIFNKHTHTVLAYVEEPLTQGDKPYDVPELRIRKMNSDETRHTA